MNKNLSNITIKEDEKVFFAKHLAMLIKSGIPIGESLATLEEQSENKNLKTVVNTINTQIEKGMKLSEALATFPKIFNGLFINLIKIGEQSGNLEGNLAYLAVQLQKERQFRQRVAAASMYPAIVLIAVLLVSIQISLFVMPKLIDLFESMDIKLPLGTQILLMMSITMRDYGIWIFGGLFLFLIIFNILIKIKPIKYVWQNLLLRLPIFGNFITKVEMTSFCRNLGGMIKSGVPITTALTIQKSITTSLIYGNYYDSLFEAVKKGISLKEELASGKYKFIPKIAEKMLSVGEKSGNLDESCLYLGEFFEEEVDNTTKNLSTILEPALLLFVGIIVAFVAFSIISPIYQFTSSIKR